MARRQILSLSERESLLALPDDELTLTRMAYFSEHDLALISAHRKPASRFGFAVLLCYLKNVGFAPDKKIPPSDALLKHIASRLKLTGDLWPAYLSGRDTTRREHLTELYRYLGVKAFTGKIQQDCITHLLSMATRTDKGILLAEELLVWLRQNNVIIPAIDVVERTCAEAMAGGDKIVFQTLNAPLTPAHRHALDRLLESSDNQPSRLTWLLQPPGKINGKNVLQHLDRLSSIESLALPEGIDRTIHQNRLLKLAREGRKMSSRDLTHVLDGLLYHESDLEIREHYTDTAGFTDHVFALMHLLGFAFCPRIRDLHDKKLFIKGKADQYPALQSLISTTSMNLKEIEIHWREVLRLATSIKQGTVTASLMLKKLASYPKQNGLAKALREIGRIERTLFMLDWFRDPALRRRVQAGLNKGEARNALARAVFLHRLGEIRDRKPENQSYRASGLTLLTAAISLWNTVYMERAVDALKRKGMKINEQLLSHLSPLGWEHINLTGDYIWKSNRIPASGKFRRLRPAKVERSKNDLNVQ